jgi:hypothetical protein
VPGTTHPVTGLEQDPVPHPGPVELDRSANAGEAGADDRHLMVGLRIALAGHPRMFPLPAQATI